MDTTALDPSTNVVLLFVSESEPKNDDIVMMAGTVGGENNSVKTKLSFGLCAVVFLSLVL